MKPYKTRKTTCPMRPFGILAAEAAGKAAVVEAMLALYERGTLTEDSLRARLGMGYLEAVRYWYAYQVAKAKGRLRYEKLAGRLTPTQFRDIIGEG